MSVSLGSGKLSINNESINCDYSESVQFKLDYRVVVQTKDKTSHKLN